jgi:hypothetical protein
MRKCILRYRPMPAPGLRWPAWSRHTSHVRRQRSVAHPPLLSDAGVPVEKIARLVGRIETITTETVYRYQIRPVVTDGAEVMDQLFPRRGGDAELLTHERP